MKYKSSSAAVLAASSDRLGPHGSVQVSTLYNSDDDLFPIQTTQYCGNSSKVVGATLFNADYPSLW